MTLIALAADKGSPGVTTSAVALAAVWPRRALYAECDPHGGDLVYRMPAEHGGPLDPNRGLVSLAVDARRGFDASVLPQHTQRLRGGLEILVGLGNADQAHGMAGLWTPLGRALDRFGELPYGADVIADCGRIGPDSPTIELLAQSGLVLLVARAEAEQIAHVRDRANSLSARLHATQGSSASLARPPIGIVLIAPPGQAKQLAKQVSDLLAATTPGAEVLGVIAHDESGAAALNGRGRGRVDKALVTRTARELAGTIAHRYGLIRTQPAPQQAGQAAQVQPYPQAAPPTSMPAQSMASQPIPPQPIPSQSAAPQPVVSPPVVSQPFVPQSAASQPVSPQPVVSQPVVSHPVVSQPFAPLSAMSQSMTAQPGARPPYMPPPPQPQPHPLRAYAASRPQPVDTATDAAADTDTDTDPSDSDTVSSTPINPTAVIPGSAHPGSAHPHSAHPDSAHPDSAHPDSAHPDSADSSSTNPYFTSPTRGGPTTAANLKNVPHPGANRTVA